MTSVKTNAGWNNVTGVEKSHGQGFADYFNPSTQAYRKSCTSNHHHERGE
jgi:hypothetical protein